MVGTKEKRSRLLERLNTPESFDVAAGVGSNAMNSFVQVHYAKNRDAYKGSGSFPEVSIDYEWDVAQPAVISFAPFPAVDAERYATEAAPYLVEAIDKTTIESAQQILRENTPSVKLYFSKIDSTLKFDGNELPITVDFTVLADVKVEEGNLRLVPVSAYIGDIQAFDKDVKEKVASLKLSSDWEKLVKHVVNTYLKNHLPAYIAQWKLPSAIRLFDGFVIGDLDASVHDNHIVLTGSVTEAFFLNLSSEIQPGSFEPARTSADELNKLVDQTTNPLDSDIYLLAGPTVFDLLGKKYLATTLGDRVNGNDGHWRWNFNWSVTTSNPNLRINGTGLAAHVDARGSITNGDLWYRTWVHCTFTGSLSAPNGVDADAVLSVGTDNSIHASARIRPFRPRARISFGGWCGIANYPVSAKAEDAAEKYLREHPVQFDRRIIQIPTTFPGADFTAQTTLRSVNNVDGMLAFSGDLVFTP